MLKPLLVIILIFLIAGAGYYYYTRPALTEISYEKIDYNQKPKQLRVLDAKEIKYQNGSLDVTIVPLYQYDLSGRILSKKKYAGGWNSKLAPYDLAIGWEDVGNLDYIKDVEFRQLLRWYTFRYDYSSKVDKDYISLNSANNHIIPATQNIGKVLRIIGELDVVRIKGFLVNVHGTYKNRGVTWNSSTTRNDTGDGACEIIYATEIQIEDRIYR